MRIGTGKSARERRDGVRDGQPVPVDQIRGSVTEERKRQEGQTQTQTKVEQKIEITPPTSKKE